MDIPPRGAVSSNNPSKPLIVDVDVDMDGLLTAPTPRPSHLFGQPSSTVETPRLFPGKVTKPRTVETIFEDFSFRRYALIRALTADWEEFYSLCDPDKELMCLYGHANGSWELMMPEDDLPQDLPEPALGINLRRDDMNRLDWFSFVAIRADSWLISVAFYFGVFLDSNERMCLFNMMNDIPTVYESFVGINDKYDRAFHANEVPRTPDLMDNVGKNYRGLTQKSDEEDEVRDSTFCAVCGHPYHQNGFWICCDVCKQWSHGRCVKINAYQAKQMDQFKCHDCIYEEIGEYDINISILTM